MLVGGWDGVVVGDIVGGILGLCVGYWDGVKLGLSVFFLCFVFFGSVSFVGIQKGHNEDAKDTKGVIRTKKNKNKKKIKKW